MANDFGTNRANLAGVFVPVLDEVYKRSSLTGILDGASELARFGAAANELTVPTLTMDGLGDYSRDTGYAAGDVSLTNATYKCAYDRGRMFTVDALDDRESAEIAFGRLAGEFIRTQVVPEIDAWRFASYAGKSGISAATPGAISTAAALVSALRAGLQTMDNAEVPYEGRVLFITGALHDLIDDMDLTKSSKVLSAFSDIVKVPAGRFYNSVTLYDGVSEGETGGGYAKATGGKALNFLIVQKDAVIQYQKHTVPKIIAPGENQTADAWKFGYRTVGIAEVYAKRLKGIYKHEAAS